MFVLCSYLPTQLLHSHRGEMSQSDGGEQAQHLHPGNTRDDIHALIAKINKKNNIIVILTTFVSVNARLLQQVVYCKPFFITSQHKSHPPVTKVPTLSQRGGVTK